jgi:hypothetical protein
MLTNTLSKKVWLALAAVALLGAASPALAKAKHQVSRDANAYASVQAPRVHGGESGAMLIQDRDYNESVIGTTLDR